MQRDEVNAVGAEGPAAEQAFRRQGETRPESVLRERLNGVVGTARIEPARRDAARRCSLVRQHRADCGPRRQIRGMFGPCPSRFPRRLRRPQQGLLDKCRELRRLAPCGCRFDPEQVRAPGKGGRDVPGRLPHAAPECVADHGIATVFPNCISHLGIHARRAGVRGHEGGAHRPATRPGTGTLQLAEGCPGLDSSNRPGGHKQLRR